ncbi:MAG: hypothetical protein AB7P08_16110 [Burkholderiales bacterium]
MNRYFALHQEGRRLVQGWFERSFRAQHDETECFEAFIFAWFAVNAWAACVTGQDGDAAYIRALGQSRELREQFQSLLAFDSGFSKVAGTFYSLWPIFRAQDIRRRAVHAPAHLNRVEIIEHYFGAGLHSYAPECWRDHKEAGEPVPLDWLHTLAAIYRVRCNLFHGEKAAHSEMDRIIVRSAYMVLIGFFRGARLL